MMTCFMLARDKEEFKKYEAGSYESDSFLDIYGDDKEHIASIIFRVLTSANGRVSPLFVVLDKKDKKNNCKANMDTSNAKDLLSLLAEIFVKTHEELSNGHIRNKAQNKIVDCLKCRSARK